MNLTWIKLLTLFGIISATWLSGPLALTYAKQILVPNISSTEPGTTPGQGQGAQLGMLPNRNVAGQPYTFKTPLPSTQETASTKGTPPTPCPPPTPRSETSLSSRQTQTGLELAEECQPSLLSNREIDHGGQQAGQAGNRESQVGKSSVSSD